MIESKIGKFSKFLILFISGLSLIFILGRDHYLLGIALIIGRWFLLIVGLILAYWLRKREYPKFLTVLLYSSLTLISIEYAFIKLNEAHLETTSHTQTLSLLTYNVYFKNKHPRSIVKRIKATSPDVLCFQELTPNINSYLIKSIGTLYPYRLVNAINGTHGIGVYSKYPIKKITELKNQIGLPYAQLMQLIIKGRKVGLVNVHLASPSVALENPDRFFSLLKTNHLIRKKQINKINLALQNNYPERNIIMTGDLNTTEYEPLYRDLCTNWVNINKIASKNAENTFPNSNKTSPLFILDYVFIKGRIQALDTKVLQGGTSDHLAVYAVLGLE